MPLSAPATPTSKRFASRRSASQRSPDDPDDGERDERLAQAPPHEQHVDALRGRHQRAVRMARDARDCGESQSANRGAPPRSAPTAARCEVRQQARAEEEAVHAPIDSVEEQHPARETRIIRDKPGGAPGQSGDEQRDQRQAPERERGGAEAQCGQSTAGVRGDRGEEVVRRGLPPRALCPAVVRAGGGRRRARGVVFVRQPRRRP